MREPAHVPDSGVLSLLSIGDPLAENEFATLGNYYVRTDHFHRARRGEVNLVTGRKGTGKTALFGQIRDDVEKYHNLVIELKPEGYQLLKFKEQVLRDLEQGSKDHLITAFWEYLIYMEIAAKLLEVDAETHYGNQEQFELYEALRTVFERDKELATKGDFSARLNALAAGMAIRYLKILPGGARALSQSQVTEIVHSHEIGTLRRTLERYLVKKDEVWLLFDNLDKGWTPGGVAPTDILVLRCLLDAMRKIRNDLRRSVQEFHGIPIDKLDTLVEHMLYYGVFGLRTKEQGIVYVYDLSYDMKRMKMLMEKFPECSYVMHPVLRPSLSIKS